MIVQRKALVAAPAQTIWSLFAGMDWERWDQDVRAIEDVRGGLVEGGALTFVMVDGGTRIPTVLSNVRENEGFTFSGSVFFGSVAMKGSFELEPQGECDTAVTYTFNMTGVLGSLVSMFKSRLVIEGTEVGLANVKKLSEEAEAAKQSTVVTVN